MTLLKMSIASSFLIVFVLLARAAFLRRLPKRALLLLWGIVLCRLLIPFSVPVPLSVVNDIQQYFMESFSSPELATTLVTDTVPMTVSTSPRDVASYLPEAPVPAEPPTEPLTLVWLVGAAGLAGCFLLTHARTHRQFQAALPESGEDAMRFIREHPTRRRVAIRRSDRILSPLTYGILRPVILLPRDDPPDGALPYILEHEYLHVRRLDTLKKCVLAAALCAHWFNPLVWAMFFAANRDIELACDEGVVRSFGEDSRSIYAMALIGMEERKLHGIAALCSHFSQSAVEVRIRAIMRGKRTAARRVLAMVLVLVCLGGCFAVSAVNTGTLGLRAMSLFQREGTGIGPVLYLKSVRFDGGRIHAVIAAQGRLDGEAAVNGAFLRYAGSDFQQILFESEGTLREKSVGFDSVQYYEYDAEATAEIPGTTLSSDEMLVLTVKTADSTYTAKVPFSGGKEGGNTIIIGQQQTFDGGITVTQVVLSSTELTLYGQSPALLRQGTQAWGRFPDFTFSILLADSRRIDRDSKSLSGGGAQSYDENTGQFSVSMSFRDLRAWKINWALNLSQVTGIMIDGKMFRVSR